MSTRNDEEKFLHRKIAAYPGFRSFTFDDILKYIGPGNSMISLEMTEKEAVKQNNDEDIQEITKTMPSLLSIAQKPRMFIRSIEEKVPIDQAKRINYNAIAKLSRDSNDWYSRTLVSVKPKQVHAEITEDTLDIYENKFIVTLIDLIYKTINREYVDCLTKRKNSATTLALEIVSKFYTGQKDWSFNDVCYGNRINTDSGYIISLDQKIERLDALRRQLSIIRSSELYSALRGKKRLSGNVQKTNILMFDFNYNRAYKLWLFLRERHFEESTAINDEPISQSDLEMDYRLYCFLALSVCISKIGAKCVSTPTFRFGPDGLTSDGVAEFEYKGNTLELEIDDGYFKLCYRMIKKKDQSKNNHKKVHSLSNTTETIDKFWFRPQYDNLEEADTQDLYDRTTGLFNELSSVGSENGLSGCYAMISLNLDAWGDKPLSEVLSRRLFNSGDNLSYEEPQENKDLWMNFKTGIQLISAYPFRGPSGLKKICKILYNHLMKPNLRIDGMTSCPICSNTLSHSEGTDIYLCGKCNIKISYTYCKVCDRDKKKPFFWIKYKDDRVLDEKSVMESCESNPLYKMDTISQIMPKCTLTSFDVDGERKSTGMTVYKFKTICPRCGNKLGE